MSVVLVDLGAGMARLSSVVICFNEFCVSPLNESEGTVDFGSTKREIMSAIDLQK